VSSCGGARSALIGGTGKSTLVKILSGIYQPDAGEIRFDGAAVHHHSASGARWESASFTGMAFDNLSVAENLFVNSQPTGRPGGGRSCGHGRRRYCASWVPTSTPKCLPAA
jgi:rhamnose transport system ATP-binding protein